VQVGIQCLDTYVTLSHNVGFVFFATNGSLQSLRGRHGIDNSRAACASLHVAWGSHTGCIRDLVGKALKMRGVAILQECRLQRGFTVAQFDRPVLHHAEVDCGIGSDVRPVEGRSQGSDGGGASAPFCREIARGRCS
jgi:hypothetical protein